MTRDAFKPFSALSNDAAKFPGANFAETVDDAAAGLDMALRLIEASILAEDDAAATPFLSRGQQFELFRLVKATTRLLQQSAYSHVEWANTHGAAWVRGGAFSPEHCRRDA